MITPRLRAESTIDSSGTFPMVILSSCWLVPNHITSVLDGFSRRRLTWVKSKGGQIRAYPANLSPSRNQHIVMAFRQRCARSEMPTSASVPRTQLEACAYGPASVPLTYWRWPKHVTNNWPVVLKLTIDGWKQQLNWAEYRATLEIQHLLTEIWYTSSGDRRPPCEFPIKRHGKNATEQNVINEMKHFVHRILCTIWWWLSSSVWRWSSSAEVSFQRHPEAARATNTQHTWRQEFLGSRSSTVEWPSIRTAAAGTFLRFFQTIFENTSLWRDWDWARFNVSPNTL